MHIILEIQKSADNDHTFVAKRQVHSRNCSQDNDFFYYNYYHFHDPRTLITEYNTMIIF